MHVVCAGATMKGVVPLGYKQTEVGVIPEDWEVRILNDLAQIRTGIAKNSNISANNPVDRKSVV